MFYTKSHVEDLQGETYGSPIESDLYKKTLTHFYIRSPNDIVDKPIAM